ncbi:ATP-binding protein [Horticoccus sp. 23ND18S-11]|uniref:ATP-binding protein n=1 Tax=Horticoccus sp. 23ND18S-11 TaxID=3391832 RepID=UPI0039C97B88
MRKWITHWWNGRTIRFRLALWYAAGGSVLLAGFSATLYLYVADRMGRPLAHELILDLAEVKRKVAVTPDGNVFWNGARVAPFSPWTTEYPWFELWDANQQLVCRLWPFAANRVVQAPSAPFPGRETLAIYNVAPDLRLRVYSVPIVLPDHNDAWMIRLLRIHEPTGDALGALRVIIFVTLPIVVALLVIGGYVITRRWLNPLGRMAAEANRITADDLSRRLPVANPHDELGRLASVFNVTLDRLQGSFDALDRFVADASHELRTPLTTLRSVGEVGLRRGRTVEEYREIIGSMLEEAQRLQLLIQRLLELASAEGGAADVHRAPIRIDEYSAACVNELSILAEYKRQQIQLESVPCTAETDPVLFRQALQNLVDNAIKYSPDGALIRVAVRDRVDAVEVSVTDEGGGISPENRIHLTDRFFRPDRGRGRNSGGFGLGLSITKAYMRVTGGSLEYAPVEPKGSTFRLVLPKG